MTLAAHLASAAAAYGCAGAAFVCVMLQPGALVDRETNRPMRRPVGWGRGVWLVIGLAWPVFMVLWAVNGARDER